MVLAILDGHHALSKVAQRLQEQRMLALLPGGATGADEIGGDHRFAVAWLERVQSAKPDGNDQGETPTLTDPAPALPSPLVLATDRILG